MQIPSSRRFQGRISLLPSSWRELWIEALSTSSSSEELDASIIEIVSFAVILDQIGYLDRQTASQAIAPCLALGIEAHDIGWQLNPELSNMGDKASQITGRPALQDVERELWSEIEAGLSRLSTAT